MIVQHLSLDEALRLAEKVEEWDEVPGLIDPDGAFEGRVDNSDILISVHKAGTFIGWGHHIELFPWNHGKYMLVSKINERGGRIEINRYYDSKIKPVYERAREYMLAKEREKVVGATSEARALVR